MSAIGWQNALIRGLQARGFKRCRPSHMNLLHHIDAGGTRITEIADRARLSKQAVGQLLVACLAQRLVRVVTDPDDRRAKIVTFAARGRAVIEAEREVIEAIEAQVRRALGAEGDARLRELLGQLAALNAP